MGLMVFLGERSEYSDKLSISVVNITDIFEKCR